MDQLYTESSQFSKKVSVFAEQTERIRPKEEQARIEASDIIAEITQEHQSQRHILRLRQAATPITDADVKRELDIDDSKCGLSIALIGGVVFHRENEEEAREIKKITTYFLQEALLLIASSLKSREQELLVTTAGSAVGGVIGIVGNTRLEAALRGYGDFSFIGVIPRERVYEEEDALDGAQIAFDAFPRTDMSSLNAHISYALMTCNAYPNNQFGGPWDTASDRICSLTNTLTTPDKRITLVMNGGIGVAYELVQKLQQNERVIVVKGSDRFADALAAWYEGDESHLSEQQLMYLEYFKFAMGEDVDAYKARIEIFDIFNHNSLDEAVLHFVNTLAPFVY